MTPKEKAEELFDKMQSQTYSYQKYAGATYSVEEIGREAGKKCALITLDECLKILNVWSAFNMPKSSEVIFYEEVKEELEKL